MSDPQNFGSVFSSQNAESSASDYSDPESSSDLTNNSCPEDNESQCFTHITDLPTKIKSVLAEMERQGIQTADLLVGLSWGDEKCNADPPIRNARTALLHDARLPSILSHWAFPPRPPQSKNRRPKGARSVMSNFAANYIQHATSNELEKLAPKLYSPTTEDVDSDHLITTTYAQFAEIMKATAPITWNLLDCLTKRPSSRHIPLNKNSDKMIITIICMLSYMRSHHRSRLQKLLSIYFKFKGVSAKGFETLHTLGVTMSHKWTSNSVERMSVRCMEEVRKRIQLDEWIGSYDNINIPFRVFSQRIDNQGELSNGTAATIYIKPNAKHLPRNANQLLKKKRAEGQKNPLTELNVMDLAGASYPFVRRAAIYQILRTLFDSDEFDFKTYSGRKAAIIEPPPPINLLPTGPEHRTLQYLLGSVGIPEASYEDNARLIEEWFHQLGIQTDDDKRKLSTDKVIIWVGDQLTVDRLRGLYKYRAKDCNSYDRLDFIVPVFGWFHLQMAFASSLHKQYLGTPQSRGLRQAFLLLNKKGLTKPQVKGPFHHDLEEALYHIAEAHLRVDWIELGQVVSLSELRNCSPNELYSLAELIYDQRASSEAMDILDAKPDNMQDEELHQVIMWNRDILQYIVLDQAIRSGDVGIMEAMLPHLLFRFLGGGNGKYAAEVLEMLQLLHRELPNKIADFVRHHAWLVNTTGRPGLFCPIDKAQEHNIKDIKVSYRSEGPNINWQYFRKLHPAIPTIRKVSEHIEQEFATLTRGKKHGVPQKERDIARLVETYQAANYHTYKAGRKTKHGTLALDVATTGCLRLQSGAVLERWQHLRTFPRATDEMWESWTTEMAVADEDVDEDGVGVEAEASGIDDMVAEGLAQLEWSD